MREGEKERKIEIDNVRWGEGEKERKRERKRESERLKERMREGEKEREGQMEHGRGIAFAANAVWHF